jgi:hypothetical protein
MHPAESAAIQLTSDRSTALVPIYASIDCAKVRRALIPIARKNSLLVIIFDNLQSAIYAMQFVIVPLCFRFKIVHTLNHGVVFLDLLRQLVQTVLNE